MKSTTYESIGPIGPVGPMKTTYAHMKKKQGGLALDSEAATT